MPENGPGKLSIKDRVLGILPDFFGIQEHQRHLEMVDALLKVNRIDYLIQTIDSTETTLPRSARIALWRARVGALNTLSQHGVKWPGQE